MATTAVSLGIAGSPAGAVIKARTTNGVRLNNNILTADDQLVMPVLPGQVLGYRFTLFVQETPAGGPGINFRVRCTGLSPLGGNFPDNFANSNWLVSAGGVFLTTTYNNIEGLARSYATASLSGTILIWGFVAPTLPGELRLDWCQSALDAVNAVQIKRGSFMETFVIG